MLIICPKCFTQYQILDEDTSLKGKKCHCSACGCYFDLADDVIELTQQINRDNFNIHMNNPEGGYKSIVLQSDLNLYYYSRDGYYSFFWVDDTYFYHLYCPDTIELSEIEKIIDSMEPTKS